MKEGREAWREERKEGRMESDRDIKEGGKSVGKVVKRKDYFSFLHSKP